MRKIKSFKIFESGLPYSHVREIQLAINNLLSEDRFQPHINQVNRWIGGMRKFNVGVSANESKWGVQYDVTFQLDEPVDINLINEEIKYSWRDIMDIIMDKAKEFNQIKVTKFNYFGYTGEGRKNGHTKEIEDITDELIDTIESGIKADVYGSETSSHIHPIYIQFTATK